MKFANLAPVCAVLLAAMAVPASANGIVASHPAANATISPLKTLSFTFAEPVDPKSSGATLTMTGMPGMADHPPMKMSAMKTGFADGGRTITLSAKGPLAAGSYRADWFVTGAGGHRASGQFVFTVR